jgi:hypothetical protein
MDRSKIVARFSLLPRRHKVAAACVTAVIAVGGFLVSTTAPRRYESTAVLSYDMSEMHALSGAEREPGQHSAAHVATAILTEDGQAGPESNHVSSGEVRSHLEVSEEPGSSIRVRWMGTEPMETMVAAQDGARMLTAWSPSADALMQTRSDGSEAKAPGDGLAVGESASHAPVRQSSEEVLLRATLSVLDMQLKGLQGEVRSAGKEQGGRGWMKSASLVLGAKADGRSQIEKKISNLHKQQALIQTRLNEEIAREAASAHGPDRSARGSAASGDAPQAAMKPVTEQRVAMTPHPLFVLAEPMGAARVVSDWRSSAWGLGITLALLGGALYLAFALWRFRPVHGALVLRELLPKEVIFVGCTPETHE